MTPLHQQVHHPREMFPRIKSRIRRTSRNTGMEIKKEVCGRQRRGDHANLQGDVTAVPNYVEGEDLGDETVSEEEDVVSSSEDKSDFEESVPKDPSSEDESDIEKTFPQDAEESAGTATAPEGTAFQTSQSCSILLRQTSLELSPHSRSHQKIAHHIPQSGWKTLLGSGQWRRPLPLCLQLQPIQVLRTPTLLSNTR